MTRNREIPWSQIFAEGAAIIVSILLAFWIQAWWESQLEQEREREILESLLDDFDQTRINLIDGISFHTAVKNSNNRLLEAVTATGEPLSEAEFDRLLLNLSWWDASYPFTTGAVNSVITGGELAIISNDEIRQTIADWPTKIVLVEGNRAQDHDFFWDIWMPYLRQMGLIPQISEIDTTAPGRPYRNSVVVGFPVTNRKSMSSIISDEKFHNILTQKRWVQDDILTYFAGAIAQIDSMTELVQAELGDSH